MLRRCPAVNHAPSLRPLAAAVALVVGGVALLACGGAASPQPPAADPGDRPCTLLGCVQGYSLQLEPADGRWAPGHYAFEVTTPAGTTTCEGDLPLPPCDRQALTCSGPPVAIGVSGCALPPDQHGFASIDLPEGPAHLEVTIRRDGVQLAHTATDPAYRTVEPNGPGCGPTCRQASGRLSW